MVTLSVETVPIRFSRGDRKAGLECLVGVRMRKLRAAGEVLSRTERYHEVSPNLKVKETPHQGRRHIVCLNPEEVDRDAKVREEAPAKLQEKLRSGKPVYHWTEKRIRGHVMVCFLALVLGTALRRKLAQAQTEVRYDDFLQHLTEMRAVELHPDGRS